MPSGESNTENPPKTDIPGSHGSDGGETATAEMQCPFDELAHRRYRPEDRHELHRVMRQRRRAGGEGVMQFDYLPVNEGWDTLLVRGELLITQESFERAGRSLTELELKEDELGCEHLRGEIVRLTHRQGREYLTAPERAHAARMLRRHGHSAALTATMITGGNGPVGKHQGGPRPARAKKLSVSAESRGPKVAIIDTGISQQRRSTVSDRSQLDDLHQFPLGNSSEARAERHDYLSLAAGHGTFVTGIVQQLAPDADITVYRALDSDGTGSEVNVACAMIRAVLDGNQIINLSLGCQTHDDIPPIAIERALKIISKWEQEQPGRELVIVAAAGNSGDTRPCWPAAFHDVVAVAGLEPALAPAQWSSRGIWVNCSTIGQGVVSTFVNGTESPVVTAPGGCSAAPVPRPPALGGVEWYLLCRAADHRQARRRVPAWREELAA